MKLLIIGHSVADIMDKDGAKIIQPGGIFYTASILKILSSADDEIFLCTQVDDQYYHLYKNVYEGFDLTFLEKVSSIPVVELTLSGHFERKEHYKNISGKLNIDFTKLKDFDSILINMITGFDIDLEQIKNIRQTSNAIIYFDVHTLSRGMDKYMHREFRQIPEFDQWARNIDIIQCNQHEIFSLSEKQNEYEIIEELFSYGVKVVCLTKGESGVRVFYSHKNEITSYFRPVKQVSSNNKVGCGDAFGAAFFYGYISHRNIFKAAESASSSAEFTASIMQLSEIRNLKANVAK
ncbi:MAG: carbohydrate kinase family protein [Ignavibacteriaceae bacterium]